MSADLAFAGLDEHLRLLASGEVTSRAADRPVPGPDRAPRPGAQRLPRRVRRARAGRGHAGRRAPPRRRGPPAAGRPDRDQGRHRHPGRGHRLGHRRGRDPGRRGLRARAPAAHRGRRVPRQDQRPRADDHAVHGVADVGHHAQPVGPPAQRRRVERRLCGGRRGRARLGGGGLRRRRLDPDPGRRVRPVRPQARARPRVDGADGRAVARALDLGRDLAPRDRQRPLLRRGPRRRRVVRRGGVARARPAADRGVAQAAPAGAARGRTPSSSAALEGTADALRSLGHDVVDRELRLGLDVAAASSRATCAASTTRAGPSSTRSAWRGAPAASCASAA